MLKAYLLGVMYLRNAGRQVAAVSIAAIVLAACGLVSGTSSRDTGRTTLSGAVPTAFSRVKWSRVQLPGSKMVPPGAKPGASCGMRVGVWRTAGSWGGAKAPLVYYFNGFDPQPLAVVPGYCARFNQSPVSLFIYAPGRLSRPELLEVLYEGNYGVKGLTASVPTASSAATKPYGWSGEFLFGDLVTKSPYRYIAVRGNRLFLSGLVIPVGGTPPVPYYSATGLVQSSYTYKWQHGLFRVVSASAGVPPTAA